MIIENINKFGIIKISVPFWINPIDYGFANYNFLIQMNEFIFISYLCNYMGDKTNNKWLKIIYKDKIGYVLACYKHQNFDNLIFNNNFETIK